MFDRLIDRLTDLGRRYTEGGHDGWKAGGGGQLKIQKIQGV
jgi:hypothetical protein